MNVMKYYHFLWVLLIPFLFSGTCMAQTAKKSTPQTTQWKTVCEDEAVTISYNPKIETDKKGNHIVWVKAVYRATDWQWYFANQIGSSQPVTSTKTKAMYDEAYHYVLLRQVICYDKAGKVLYNSGDDISGGWSPVNASDPVGIVGEFLWDKNEKSLSY